MATVKQLSSIKEGFCPHCSASLNFSEEDREEGAKILCPKFKKEFLIEESQKEQKEVPKKKGGLTTGVAIALMFFILVPAFYIVATYEETPSAPPEKKEPTYEIGQSLSGVSMQEISSNWLDEKDKSSVKADEYLKSLKGTSIVWIGEIEDISNYEVYYLFSDTENRKIMKVKVNDSIFDNFAYIDVTDNQEYIDLNKGTIVKITGKIAGFNTKGAELMLSPELEYAKLEVMK